MFSIQLLGQPKLLLDGQSIETLRRKSRALVYYLTSHRKPLTREQLLVFFWPDLDRPSAQQTLRTTLHELRKALGDVLIIDKDSLAFSPETEVDTWLFETNLSSPSPDLGVLKATLDLYHGDFLEGFVLADSPEFDDWLDSERERYRLLAIKGFTALANRYEGEKRYKDALETLKRALSFDPLQEDVQREAMRIHYLSGDRAGAIRRYEGLRKLLKDEMGVTPMPETRALYDSIVNDALPGRQDSVSSQPARILHAVRAEQSLTTSVLPFTGRIAELETLRGLSSSDQRKLVLIEGEPGIGKTRLAEEYIHQLGALPVIGIAHELESSLPYQPVIEALRGLLPHPEWPALDMNLRTALPPIWRMEIARLLPELAISPTPQKASKAGDEWRLWEAVNQFLLTLARQHPVIVFIDDLQWADSSTLGMLGYLVRQTGTAKIYFLAATRPLAPRSTLATLRQTLAREGKLVHLALSRLEPEEIAAIARQLSTDYAYPLADWLTHISEGNPFVLAELVRYAQDNGILSPHGVVNLNSISESSVVPHSVYSFIRSRLQRISGPGRQFLDAAAAVGREFEFDLVSRASELSETTSLDALDELLAGGIIRTMEGSLYTFDHSLTMEVVYNEMSKPRQRLLHRRIGENLEKAHQDEIESIAGLLVKHFSESNVPERATAYALIAGQEAFHLAAWTEAVAFFEQALEKQVGSERMSTLMELGEARMRGGQLFQASETFREAQVLAQTLNDISAEDTASLALAQSFLQQARYTEAIALAQKVRDGDRCESSIHAEVVWGTVLSIEGAELAEAACHLRAAEALLIEQTPSDLASLAQIKFELGGVAAQQGDLQLANTLYRETLEVAKQFQDQDATYLVLGNNNLAYHLHMQGDPTAEQYGLTGLSLAQEKGYLSIQPYLYSTLGVIALDKGALEAAEKHFLEGLAIAERLSIPERIAGITAYLGLTEIKRGQTTLAIHHLSTALAQADALGTRHLAAQIRLWLVPLLPLSEARMRLAEARAIAESGGRRLLLEEVNRLEKQISPQN